MHPASLELMTLLKQEGCAVEEVVHQGISWVHLVGVAAFDYRTDGPQEAFVLKDKPDSSKFPKFSTGIPRKLLIKSVPNLVSFIRLLPAGATCEGYVWAPAGAEEAGKELCWKLPGPRTAADQYESLSYNLNTKVVWTRRLEQSHIQIVTSIGEDQVIKDAIAGTGIPGCWQAQADRWLMESPKSLAAIPGYRLPRDIADDDYLLDYPIFQTLTTTVGLIDDDTHCWNGESRLTAEHEHEVIDMTICDGGIQDVTSKRGRIEHPDVVYLWVEWAKTKGLQHMLSMPTLPGAAKWVQEMQAKLAQEQAGHAPITTDLDLI